MTALPGVLFTQSWSFLPWNFSKLPVAPSRFRYFFPRFHSPLFWHTFTSSHHTSTDLSVTIACVSSHRRQSTTIKTLVSDARASFTTSLSRRRRRMWPVVQRRGQRSFVTPGFEFRRRSMKWHVTVMARWLTTAWHKFNRGTCVFAQVPATALLLRRGFFAGDLFSLHRIPIYPFIYLQAQLSAWKTEKTPRSKQLY